MQLSMIRQNLTTPPELVTTALNHFEKGGEVMLPLAFVSAAMWLLILQIGWQLLFVGRERSIERCFEGLRSGKPKGCSWQKEILRKFVKKQSHEASIDHRLMESLELSHRNKAQRTVNTVLILAAAAPLLGLLGTVMGMIATFDTIGRFGTGNAKALAAGISEALITTQTGLIISIPGLLAGTVLKRRIDRLQDRIHCFGLGVLNYLDLQKQAGHIPGKHNVQEAG